ITPSKTPLWSMKRNHPTGRPSSTFCQRPAAVGWACTWAWAGTGRGVATDSARPSVTSESARKLENMFRIMITWLTQDWNGRRLRLFREGFQHQKHWICPSLPASGQLTPSFFCRLEDDVVYWNTRRLSG